MARHAVACGTLPILPCRHRLPAGTRILGCSLSEAAQAVATALGAASMERRRARMTDTRRAAFLFDLDGTLVDSVYEHVLAWQEALTAEGIELSVWRIHRKIGMSGGLFMNQLLRETKMDITPDRVERLQRLHAEAYQRFRGEIRPLRGARALLDALTEAQIPWAIATSGRMSTAGQNLQALGVDPAVNAVITRD